ncbi:MAG: hypothetical protein ACRD68_04330, partial [Pyrinomonadaceae bacterium]
MQTWQEILTTAIVGTRRHDAPLPAAGGELGVLVSQLDAADREGALLSAAGLAALFRQAGYQPPTDLRPPRDPCAPDDADCCAAEAGQHLALMLAGEFKEVLPEWMAALA